MTRVCFFVFLDFNEIENVWKYYVITTVKSLCVNFGVKLANLSAGDRAAGWP